MKIGLFGGTFNPIHMGHLFLAEFIRCDMNLDRVIFVPAYIPPHKTNDRITGPEHRLRMIDLAIQDYPVFESSDIELKRGGISYTIDTVKVFQSMRPDDHFYFIMGADNLAEIKTWREPDLLMRMIHCIIIPRSGSDLKDDQSFIPEKFTVVHAPLIDISSTIIRQRIRDQKSIRYWVPRPVEKYIHEQGLYRE